MSAPPIGITVVTPRISDAPRTIQKGTPATCGSSTKRTPATRAVITSTMLRKAWPGSRTGAELIVPESFPQAITLPVVVRPPIRTEATTVVRENTASVASPATALPCTADHPTRRDAAPPDPLKSATISGIAVIWTRRAATAPMSDPRATPPTIHSKVRISREKRVAATATAIPKALRRLPRGADSGRPSIFRPRTKQTAAPM